MARILHLVQLYHPVATGAAGFFAAIGARLAAEGHAVTVLATDAYDLEHLWARGHRRVETPEEEHCGVRIVRFPARRLPGAPLSHLVARRLMAECSRLPGTEPLLRVLARLTPSAPQLARFLESQPAGAYDLINAANITLEFAILPALAYARRSSVPFICTPLMHLGEPGDRTVLRYYSMRHQLALLRASDRVITLTELEAEYLAEHGVARERLRTTGAGVNPEQILGGDGARFRTEQRIAGPLVLYVGTLARDKGAIQTVEAMRRLWEAGSDATLAMIGAPLEHFMRYVAGLPESVRERLRVLPYAPDAIKRDAYAAADVFAMPSRTDSFGIVYLEAWCYGVPVIGARAGGVPDVIEDGKSGLLVRFGDAAELAGAVGRLLADKKLARRLGEAGRARVMSRFTWNRVYAAVREVYEELVGLDGER
jgi:glycosyltransferase involved in cell wall biosynthesis